MRKSTIHFDTNKNKLPENHYSRGSKKKVWWSCIKDDNHSWEAPFYVINSGHGCPFCSSKRISFEKSLANVAPHLNDDFHPSRNKKPFHEVFAFSNIKVWWRCTNDHEWLATPSNRIKGSRCPYCSKQKLSKEYNFELINPALAMQWHPTLNGTLLPSQVMPYAKLKVWWRCLTEHHEWKASLLNRSNGTGCPDCCKRGKSRLKHNFAIEYPNIANEWATEKNAPFLPNQFTSMSQKSFNWKCAKGHHWKASIVARVKGASCLGCKSFGVLYPDLLAEWDIARNMPYTAYDFTRGSKYKAWWVCQRKHGWQAAIHTRTSGFRCPTCNFPSSQLELRIHCELQFIFHEVLSREKLFKNEIDIYIPEYLFAIEVDGYYWHKDRIEKDRSKDILMAENGIHLLRVAEDKLKKPILDKVIFYKKGQPHIDIISSILEYILKNIKLMKSHKNAINKYLKNKTYLNNSLFITILKSLPDPDYEKSIASNKDLVSEYDLNKNALGPEKYLITSSQAVWWICIKNHSLKARVKTRALGKGCKICNNKEPSNSYNLLVHNPNLAMQWDYNKNFPIIPESYLPKSNKNVWWICDKMHSWQARIYNRNKINGTQCPECTCKYSSPSHNLSVKYPRIAAEWHPTKNGSLAPTSVAPKSNVKYWWLCMKGHDFFTTPQKRVIGRRCHVCTHQWHLIKKYPK